MPKTILVDGVKHVFPDEATDDDINVALGGNTKAPDPSPEDVAASAAGSGGWRPRTPKAAPNPIDQDAAKTSSKIFGQGDAAYNAGSNVADHVVGAAKGAWSAVRHPWDTFVQPTVDAAKETGKQWRAGNINGNEYDQQGNYTPNAVGSAADAIPIVGPWARNVETEAHQKGIVPALAGLATDALTSEAIGKGAGKLPGAVRAVGETAQERAPGVIDRTIGALKKDTKRGNSPGRGYLEADLGTSSSMDDIAHKANEAKSNVGQSIEDTYSTSTARIPRSKVSDAVTSPAKRAIDVVTGEGGSGPSAADPYNDYMGTFGANRPSVGAPDYSPMDVWKTKRNVAENTSWTDPTQIGMKKVRQQGAGALSGVLRDAVPESGPLLDQYGDLASLSERASDRAANPAGESMSKLMRSHKWNTVPVVGPLAHSVIDSVPLRTGVATGLWKTGKAAAGAGRVLDQFGYPIEVAPYALPKKGSR